MGMLPPILVELKASSTEFMAKMGAARHEVQKLGTEGAGHMQKFGAVGKYAMLGVAGLAAGIGTAVAGMAIEGVKSAGSFQDAMERLHTQAGATQQEVAKMNTAVLAMAGPTRTSADDLAAGLYHLESAGLRGQRALNALRVAAEGAKIGGADLESVTNALNAVIASGIKGAGSFTESMGALNAIVGAGDMRMQDLADAMGTGVLAAVKGFGVSLNDVGAALAVFGDNNIRGADAATQLRLAVQFLAVGTQKADGVLKGIGLSSRQLRDDLGSGGLAKALTDLHTHLVKAGDTGSRMGDILLEAFGKKAGVGLSVLEGQFGRFKTKQEEVQAGSKNFASAWEGYTQTFAASWDGAKAAVHSMVIQLGEKLLPIATKVMNWIATDGVADLDKFIAWFSRNEVNIGNWGAAIVNVVHMLVTDVMMAFGVIVDGAAAAFGWVPGVGGKLKHAAKAFDNFRDDVDHMMTTFANNLNGLGEGLGLNLTKGMQAGINAGARQIHFATRAVVDGVVHTATVTAQMGSPSKRTMYIGRMLAEGLLQGFTGRAGELESTLPRVMQGLLDSLTARIQGVLARVQARVDAAKQQLASDRQSRADLVSSTSGNLSGFAGIGGAIGSDGAAANLSTYLTGKIGTLTTLQTDITQLKGQGLNAEMLQQLTSMSADQAVLLAQQILSGQDGSIASLNAMQKQIDAAANATANAVGNAVWGNQIAADTKHLKAILAEQRKTRQHLREAALEIGLAVAQALGSKAGATGVKTALLELRRTSGQTLGFT